MAKDTERARLDERAAENSGRPRTSARGVAAAARDGLIRGARRAPVPSIAVAIAFSMYECGCAAYGDCDWCNIPADASNIDAMLADAKGADAANDASDANADAGVEAEAGAADSGDDGDSD